MPLDRNATLTVTGPLGHALPVRLGEIIDFIVAEVRKEISAPAPPKDEQVRPT